MKLHVLGGPPCSGKSTYARATAVENSFIFDSDVLATAGGFGSNHDHQPMVTAALNAMRRGAVGWATDPDADHPDGGELWLIYTYMSERLYELLRSAGAEFTVLDPGRDTCLIRARADGRPESTIRDIERWYDTPPAYARGDDQKGGAAVRSLNLPVKLKAYGDDGSDLDDGEFVAYASIFGNVDAYGDVVVKGAFSDTLADWKSSGNTLPVLYGHDFADPFSNIGAVIDAVEDDRGLRVHGRLDLDNPKARQVFQLLKGRRLSQMSFAFDVVDGAPAEKDGEPVFELRRLNLYEVSVVPIGANQDTEILAVKSGVEGLVTAVEAGQQPLTPDARARLAGACKALAAALDDSTDTPPDTPGESQTDQADQTSDDTPPAGDPADPPDGAKCSPSVSALVTRIEILNRK